MNDHESGGQGLSESAEAARRQAALRALAQNQIQTQSEGQAAVRAPQQPDSAGSEDASAATRKRGGFAALVSGKRPTSGGRWRTVVASIAVLLVIAVAAGAGVREWLALRTPPPPTVVRIDTLNGVLTCGAQSAAWSPDSTLLAVEGMSGCGQSDGNQVNLIILYDARTGKVTQTLHPDSLVYGDQVVMNAVDAARQALGYTGGSTTAFDSLWYSPVTWAPDGRSMLLTFSVSVPPPGSGVGVNVNGLMQLGMTPASQTRLWLDKVKYQQNGFVERWDVTKGTSALIPQPKPATAYRWQSDGTLAPVTAGVSVGTPDGGSTFSIWQPGSLSYFTPMSAPSSSTVISPDQHRIVWSANVYPLSPDGRYFYRYFPDMSIVTPPSTGASVPYVKPHDQALLAQAQRMTQTAPSQDVVEYVLAWRPDGRRMASLEFDQAIGPGATSVPRSYIVSIYDTATGKVIGHVTVAVKKPDQPQSTSPLFLSWSPDGKRLMLSGGVGEAITIWEPGALPA